MGMCMESVLFFECQSQQLGMMRRPTDTWVHIAEIPQSHILSRSARLEREFNYSTAKNAKSLTRVGVTKQRVGEGGLRHEDDALASRQSERAVIEYQETLDHQPRVRMRLKLSIVGK
jgi:hypothetical protein